MRFWDGEAGRERDVLESILALLLALAGLADRAAFLPAPERPRLLALLGHAEFEARCFIMDMAFDAPEREEVAPSVAAGDAQRLAAGLRALALALAAILASPRRRAPDRAGGHRAGPPTPPMSAMPEVSQEVRAPDTS